MAEALVKFFIQRLNFVLLQESETFSGLEHHIQCLISTLEEIGKFSGDICSTQGDVAVRSWITELRDLINTVDDVIDEFIIQMDQQKMSDTSAMTKRFTIQWQEIESRFVTTIDRMAELKISATTGGDNEDNNDNPVTGEMEEGQTSSAHENPVSIGGEEEENFTHLPYYLQSCLMYCCFFRENYWIRKGRLIRLMMAEGLVQEQAGEIMEDIAEENICKLINHGMLLVKDEHRGNGTMLTVVSPYREFILSKMKEENTITACSSSEPSIPHNARRIAIYSDMMTIAPYFNNIRLRSLFVLGTQDLSRDDENWLNFNGAKFLRVLDLENTKMKSLPDEVGDLIHLTYLGLYHTGLKQLPARLGNLQALQTLDIRRCGDLTALPIEVLNLVRLRHVKMYKTIRRKNAGGVKLPPGIERFKNILTLTGIHVGGGIARELSNLIHLRRLGVMDVAEENVSELFASIMMMQSLLSLSLEVTHTFNQGTLLLSESFSPPPLLRKLRLEGILERLPNWFSLMERLTSLRLGFSHLSEDPALVLQHLPNLKNLTLWRAYEGKQLGKEFCRVGGFPKLEVLSIASHVLEEWTELEEGALPSLKYLHLHNCLRLRMLPEGLQFLTTMQQLDLLPLLDDHAERLKPDGGEENYKIRHIPRISFITMSDVRKSCPLPPCAPAEEGKISG